MKVVWKVASWVEPKAGMMVAVMVALMDAP